MATSTDTKGQETSLQARTGFNFRFYYEIKSNLSVPSDPTPPAEASGWTEIEGLKSGALPSPDKPEIDVTTTVDKVKAYLPGIGSINDISLELNFYPHNSTHQNLVDKVIYSTYPRWWKLTGQGMEFIFLGYLKSASPTFGVDAALTLPLTIKVTNKPTITWDNTTTDAEVPYALRNNDTPGETKTATTDTVTE